MKLFSFGSKESLPAKNHKQQLEEALAETRAQRELIVKNREGFGSHAATDANVFADLDKKIAELEKDIAAEEEKAA